MIVTGIFTLLEGSRGISSGQSSSESMFLQLSGVLLLETHNIFPGKWARFSKSISSEMLLAQLNKLVI